MDDFVEMTEFVRFNSDGTSDHIVVIEDKLFEVLHRDPTPYVLLRDWPPVPVADCQCWVPSGDECDWLVEVTRKVPDNA